MLALLLPLRSSPRHFTPAREAHRDPPSSPFPQNLKLVSKNEHLDVLAPADMGKRCDSGKIARYIYSSPLLTLPPEYYPKDCSEDYATQTASLPPAAHFLSTCAKRARSKIYALQQTT
jgi:hypothetical protein